MKKSENRKEVIINNICDVLRTNFNMEFTLSPELMNAPLTAPPFLLSAIELYQLLMIIEEQYQIYFAVDNLRKNNFGTISEITRLIQEGI